MASVDVSPAFDGILRYVMGDREEYRDIVLMHRTESSSVLFVSKTTGDKVAEISYAALNRAAQLGARSFMDVVWPRLEGWRKRLYDYDHVAEGTYEGDLL
jgi:hypothetical protein